MWGSRRNREVNHDDAALERMMAILWFGVALSIAALIASQTSGVTAAVGIGTLILLASIGGGCFFGFLFGLPKVVSPDPLSPANSTTASPQGAAPLDVKPAPEAGATATPATRARLLQSSTNLEKIADWLTTMIVGATLVELHHINDALLAFRDFLERTARVFPSPTGELTAGVIPTVGPVLLVFGAVCGFLYMYLNTRLVLVRLFATIERFLAGDPSLSASQQRIVSEIAQEQEGLDSTLRQQAASPRGWTVDDALGLMFNLLYKNNPDKVLQLGAELSATGARNRAEYWFYLAAAFGQKLHRLDRGTAEWLSARDNALDSARRAVSIAPNYRERLWAISDPSSNDDDLAPLRDDPEFLKIVGHV
jgi:hypothetical protein